MDVTAGGDRQLLIDEVAVSSALSTADSTISAASSAAWKPVARLQIRLQPGLKLPEAVLEMLAERVEVPLLDLGAHELELLAQVTPV